MLRILLLSLFVVFLANVSNAQIVFDSHQIIIEPDHNNISLYYDLEREVNLFIMHDKLQLLSNSSIFLTAPTKSIATELLTNLDLIIIPISTMEEMKIFAQHSLNISSFEHTLIDGSSYGYLTSSMNIGIGLSTNNIEIECVLTNLVDVLLYSDELWSEVEVKYIF